MMQKMGVEPTRYCYHTDLNRARLPIPPLLRTVVSVNLTYRTNTHIISNLDRFVNSFFKNSKNIFKSNNYDIIIN